jgi:hypothetical protein
VYKGSIKLYVPHEKWEAKLIEHGAIRIKKDALTGKEHWKAMHRKKLINLTDIEILSKYNLEVRGFYNYYSVACNASIINNFSSLMKYSMLKTFGAKYRVKTSEIKKRYTKDGKFTVKYKTREGPKESVYYDKGFRKRNKAMHGQVDVFEDYKRYNRPNSIAARLRAKRCELCGTTASDLEIHQVRRLKDLKGQSEWETVMRQIHRKTLAVCPECHGEIHATDKTVR